MTFSRLILAAVLALLTAPVAATAQDYPSRTITIVAGYPAGTPVDTIARVIADKLQTRTGQPVIVENRPGAGSNIGALAVVKASPDGYTLYLSSIANTTNPAFSTLAFDFAKDLVPVTIVCEVPVLLVVPPSGAKTIQELIAQAKAKPGDLAFGSAGPGTATHLFPELFARETGIKLTHIPYKGSSQAVMDLLPNRIQVMFSPAGTVLSHVKSGQLRALAVSGKHRLTDLDVPTFTEAGVKGLDFSLWFGLNAPAGTPAPVIAKLNKEVAAVLDMPDVKAKLLPQFIFPTSNSSEEFGAFIREDLARWKKVVDDAGLTLNQ